MKKTLLFILVISSLLSNAQITGPPPPPALSPWEMIDVNNDGFATFDIQGIISNLKARYLAGGHDMSGYTFSFAAYNPSYVVTPITTPTYTNTVADVQFLELTHTYNGNGPQQSLYFMAFSVDNISHHLVTIPYNGDKDNDGVINGLEDLNGNLDPNDDNTDNAAYPNYLDNDDDNDGILTINEDYNGNGNPADDDMNANGIPDYLDFSARGSLPLNLKLFIEGYYTYSGSGMMQSVAFNKDGVSPLTNVENIIVEMHRAAAPYELVASTSAMLKTDGTLACSFPTASVGSYYIAVKSSNGIETWSATPQSISNVALTYDFSSAANKAYGSNMKNVGGGFFALYSGDVNNDGFLDLGDYTFWETDNNAFASGSYATDFNGDGFVDLADYSIWETNNNDFIAVVKP